MENISADSFRMEVRRSLRTSRLPIANRGKPASDHFRVADHPSGILVSTQGPADGDLGEEALRRITT